MAVAGEVVTMDEEEQSERKEEEIQNKNPWPNLEELFVFKRQQGNNVIMQCKMCLPSKTELSAYKTSTSNLRKHVVRKHPSKLAVFSACSRKSLQELGSKSKQSKLPGIQAQLAVGGAIRASQGTVDRFLIRLICEGHHPFSLVEQPAFKEFAAALNPQYKMLSRPTVKSRIAEATADMKTKLTAHLSNIDHVATTTDCWSAAAETKQKLYWSEIVDCGLPGDMLL
uniref:E3 SUMO-protein ligase ZBED1-like n=1 Tax=Scatophagus argus TaxID=75038 RepID=UPI001ED8269A|nr:E3 SUMO-protein ligase ZBED1-like [Scatophagus argus]